MSKILRQKKFAFFLIVAITVVFFSNVASANAYDVPAPGTRVWSDYEIRTFSDYDSRFFIIGWTSIGLTLSVKVEYKTLWEFTGSSWIAINDYVKTLSWKITGTDSDGGFGGLDDTRLSWLRLYDSNNIVRFSIDTVMDPDSDTWETHSVNQYCTKLKAKAYADCGGTDLVPYISSSLPPIAHNY